MNAEKEPQEKPAGSSKLLIIVTIISAVIALGAGGFASYTVFFTKDKKGSKYNGAAASDHDDKKSRNKKKKGGEGQSKSALSLEPFLVNLADTPQNRYARITMKLGLSLPPEHLDKTAKNDVVIGRLRDGILSILCAKRSYE